MLTTAGSRHYGFDEDLDFIHNYYERLVLQEIIRTSDRVQNGDRDFLADVACVALNHLPPRYIRHDVDMTFFMSPQEMLELEEKIAAAVKSAIGYVGNRARDDSMTSSPAETTTNTPKKASVKKNVGSKTKNAKTKD